MKLLDGVEGRDAKRSLAQSVGLLSAVRVCRGDEVCYGGVVAQGKAKTGDRAAADSCGQQEFLLLSGHRDIIRHR